MTHYKKLQIDGLYNGMQPIQPSYELTKKELTGNDYLTLFGALSIIAQRNIESGLLYDSLNTVMDSASIQDSELYLNGFEGYELNDRYNLRSLYLSSDNVVIMSVYDNKNDTYMDFIA